MKKLTLDYEEPLSWFTIGITCQLADYKLVYRLNKALNFDFARSENFKINILKFSGSYSLYSYFDPFNESEIFLLSNKSDGKPLLPEFKQLDYLLITHSEIINEQFPEFRLRIKGVEEVLFTQIIEIESAKNHLLVAEEFELHIDKLRNN